MEKRKQFVAFGVDFSEIPHVTSEVVSNMLEQVEKDLKADRELELDPRTPRNPEAPHFSSPTERGVIVDFARSLRK